MKNRLILVIMFLIQPIFSLGQQLLFSLCLNDYMPLLDGACGRA